jgi:hypothetical protein
MSPTTATVRPSLACLTTTREVGSRASLLLRLREQFADKLYFSLNQPLNHTALRRAPGDVEFADEGSFSASSPVSGPSRTIRDSFQTPPGRFSPGAVVGCARSGPHQRPSVSPLLIKYAVIMRLSSEGAIIMRSFTASMTLLAFCIPAVGKENAKTFTYTKTKQADLEMVVYLPPGWKKTDKRPGIVFLFGGGWKNGTIKALVSWNG